LKNALPTYWGYDIMRSSFATAAATSLLALFVVCALISYIPRSTSDPRSLSLLSVVSRTAKSRPSAADSRESSPELDSEHSRIPVLLTSAQKPISQALHLRAHRSSLASVTNAVVFNRDDSLNFNRIDVQTSNGFTFVANFAFSGQVGSWERIFDFGPFWGGSGQGMGVLLARVGTSNTLTSHLYTGANMPSFHVDMNNEIQPGKQMTAAVTYQCSTAAVRFVRVQARRQYLQMSFLSVQTADGTDVALGKRAYASGSYPGTNPSLPVNGAPGTRNHPVPPPPIPQP
jgi:hypothetical protein